MKKEQKTKLLNQLNTIKALASAELLNNDNLLKYAQDQKETVTDNIQKRKDIKETFFSKYVYTNHFCELTEEKKQEWEQIKEQANPTKEESQKIKAYNKIIDFLQYRGSNLSSYYCYTLAQLFIYVSANYRDMTEAIKLFYNADDEHNDYINAQKTNAPYKPQLFRFYRFTESYDSHYHTFKLSVNLGLLKGSYYNIKKNCSVDMTGTYYLSDKGQNYYSNNEAGIECLKQNNKKDNVKKWMADINKEYKIHKLLTKKDINNMLKIALKQVKKEEETEQRIKTLNNELNAYCLEFNYKNI